MLAHGCMHMCLPAQGCVHMHVCTCKVRGQSQMLYLRNYQLVFETRSFSGLKLTD